MNFANEMQKMGDCPRGLRMYDKKDLSTIGQNNI